MKWHTYQGIDCFFAHTDEFNGYWISLSEGFDAITFIEIYYKNTQLYSIEVPQNTSLEDAISIASKYFEDIANKFSQSTTISRK